MKILLTVTSARKWAESAMLQVNIASKTLTWWSPDNLSMYTISLVIRAENVGCIKYVLTLSVLYARHFAPEQHTNCMMPPLVGINNME